MNKITQRLEFQNVFPSDKEEKLEYYLNEISKEFLLNFVGFANLNSNINFNKFFTNIEIQQKINYNVEKYLKSLDYNVELALMSREGSLRISEIILSRKNDLNTNFKNIDNEEVNLFKAFLIINKELNNRFNNFNENKAGFEKFIDMAISITFPISDLRMSETDDEELLKLMYCTIYKVEELIKFLNSDKEMHYLLEAIEKYFNQETYGVLLENIKKLFGIIVSLKQDKKFIFEVTDKELKDVINSLITDEVFKDDDFTNLKNYPIYKKSENAFAIIDNFFVINKFFKSIKFELKRVFDKKNKLISKDRKFFQFFNKDFSEDFLAKNLLNSIFYRKYFIKGISKKEDKGVPDYYVRNKKEIYLFEIKDVMISKKIKSSGNIKEIDKVLKQRFLFSNKDVGIGQLCCQIEEIVNNKFQFDEYVNTKTNFKIFPILLIMDNILEVPGINYKLNEWYKTLIKSKLKEKYNHLLIKDLLIIDINTLIYWEHYLRRKDRNFKDLINKHLKIMRTKHKVNISDYEKGWLLYQKRLLDRMNPISFRFRNILTDREILLNKILPKVD